MPVLKPRPTVTTPRLRLRPFLASDAARTRQLAGDHAIADTALEIPHPYDRGIAEQWIASHGPQWQDGRGVVFAIVVADANQLVGAVGLTIAQRHASAELGYWVGRRYWGRGYATEAARAAVDFALGPLALNRVWAHHFARNPASGRVLEKIGMQQEGLLRQAVRHQDRFEDLLVWSILRADVEP